MIRPLHESNILELPDFKRVTTMGTTILNQRLSKPISSINELKYRAKEVDTFKTYLEQNPESSKEIDSILSQIKECEDYLRTNISSDTSKTADSQILFSTELTKPLNHIPYLITLLLILKVYVTPLMALCMPLILAIMPYIILTTMMNVHISWSTYITMSKSMILGIQPNEQFTLKHIGQISWFVFSLVQSMIQPFITAYHTLALDKTIVKRGNAITQIYNLGKQLQVHFTRASIYTSSLPEPPSEVRLAVAWYEDTAMIQYLFTNCIGKMDMVYGFASNSQKWKQIHWKPSRCSLTNFHDLAINPSKVVLNSIDLDKHYLLTGPNRGGKSSMLRGILQQIMMAQTIGLTTAESFVFWPFDWIHTRLQSLDSPGKQSLFEQEVAEAASVLRRPTNQRGLVFIDEVFHSTNPPDAEFSASLFLNQLWKRKTTYSIISTHTFSIVKTSPSSIGKLCVFATEGENHIIHYTYRLQSGECYVSSARDVLKEAGFQCA